MTTNAATTTTMPGLGWAKMPAFYQRGKHTLAIPMSLHAAARNKIIDELNKLNITSGIVLLCGGVQGEAYDTDHEILFRQDSWFNYVYGVDESNFYGAINIATRKATLFIPRLPEDYVIVCGTIHPPSHFQSIYDVDEVVYTDHLFQWLEGVRCGSSIGNIGTSDMNPQVQDKEWLYLLDGINSDSGNRTKSITFKQELVTDITVKDSNNTTVYDKLCELYPNGVNTCKLFIALTTARVTKSKYEQEVMWYASVTASNAHVEVMRTVNNFNMEYQLEAKFLYEVYSKGGCRKAAYTCICGTGMNAAVLHYGHAGAPNAREFKDGDIALLDMGGEYHGYASDITCSYPVNGTFTPNQRAIYTGVLNAQIAVFAMFRDGVSWVDCHKAAEKEILKQLHRIGIITNGEITDEAYLDKLVDMRMGAVFMPHGLGHFIGCDTHDVGGYLEGSPLRSTENGLKSLRTSRVLQTNMILTIEPGCYFIPFLMERALNHPEQSLYLNKEKLNEFSQFGGVRLEDDVLVMGKDKPPRNLTTCPRLIEEVESVMNGGVWPPVEDKAPYLYRNWATLDKDGKCMKTLNIPVADVSIPIL